MERFYCTRITRKLQVKSAKFFPFFFEFVVFSLKIAPSRRFFAANVVIIRKTAKNIRSI